jgi:hypothetical protein
MLLLRTLLTLCLALFAGTTVVDPSTLDGKVIFGYQGWFMTPNNGANVGFRHWSKDPNSMNPKTVNVDIWPDMTEYPADSIQSTDLVLPGSQSAPVFSSLNPGVMDLHFKWLQDYSLDGMFLQRFLGEVQDSRFFAIRNNVTINMRAAAEKYGRTFAIMYDISEMTDDGLLTKIQNDWKYLTETLQVTQSPQYQKHNGKPVLTIWGLGFTHINVSSSVALQIVSYFQSQGYYVIGGVPFAWRTNDQDSRPDFASVYQQFDALSPWAVGRFDDSGVKSAFEVRVLDKTLSYARGQYYAPVLFPGFSCANMNSPTAPLNQIPRLAGKFFMDQADGLVNILLAKKTFLYLAMFDEMDEGTAFFKAALNKNQVPVDPAFVTLDIDGTELPSDYYLQLAGQVTANFKKVSALTSKTLLRA